MNKKEELLKAALHLFVEFGFHATPTSKIAKEAGVANGTLFHYYKTKEDLILSLYKEINTNSIDYTFANVNKVDSLELVFKSIFTNTIEWAQQNKQEFYFLQQFSNSPYYSLITLEDRNKQSEPHFYFLQEGIKTAILKPLSVELLFTLFNSQIAGINQYLSTEEFSTNKQNKIINQSFELLWDMIT